MKYLLYIVAITKILVQQHSTMSSQQHLTMSSLDFDAGESVFPGSIAASVLAEEKKEQKKLWRKVWIKQMESLLEELYGKYGSFPKGRCNLCYLIRYLGSTKQAIEKYDEYYAAWMYAEWKAQYC